MEKFLINYWNELPYKWPNVSLDYFAIMPNHVHGIIMIVGAGSPRPLIPPTDLEGGETPPLQNQPSLSQKGYLNINQPRSPLITSHTRKGMARIYEHVIRDDESLNRIREYIATNPSRWHLDRENPAAHGKDDFDDWLAKFKTLPPNKLTY
jgi:REP element-mobilizing transposase RayT